MQFKRCWNVSAKGGLRSGMDAPDKGRPMFNEAWAFLGELVDDKLVRVEYDRVQNDNYGPPSLAIRLQVLFERGSRLQTPGAPATGGQAWRAIRRASRLRGYAFVPCREKFKNYCQGDEINLNIAMVKSGLARVKTTVLWQKPKYEAELKQAEEDAKSKQLGLWSP